MGAAAVRPQQPQLRVTSHQPHDEEAATWLDTLTLARYGKRPGITYLCDLCVYMYIRFMLARVRVFAQDLSVCERWRRAG